MGRKVFISFLGTTNYIETYYSLNDEVSSKPVRFVQEALIDFLCKDWSEKDIILIFYTKTAEKRNWEDNGHERANTEFEKKGLKSTLLSKGLKVPIDKDTTIPEGFSEKEIWEIFEIVYSKLEEGDELYFDVTHAFRSIPLFSTVLFNFSKTMINTHIASVHYGAFEKLGEAFNVRKNPIEDRIAPIIDLTGIVRLQELTQTASNFIEFGKIGKIGNIEQSSNKTQSLSKKQQNIVNEVIPKLKMDMDKFDDYLLTCRMRDIRSGKLIKTIKENLDKVINSDSITDAERRLLKKLKGDLAEFSSEENDSNIEAAINWAVKYNLTQQAYTLGQEYIISQVCTLLSEYNPYTIEANKKQEKEADRNFRMYVSALLGVDTDKKFKGSLSDYENNTLNILKIGWIVSIKKPYKTLASNRNTLNHAKGTETGKKIRDSFYNAYQSCLEIIKELSPHAHKPI